jgi:C4-dicarboxylate transporter DctM subunit
MEPILLLCIVLLVVFLTSGAPFYVAFAVSSIPFLVVYAQVPGSALGSIATEAVASFTLMAIPLFVLLGSIMSRIGATNDLFNLARSFLGHFRGGLGIATIFASAGFGAMCGSGLATALAVSTIAVPELKASGYRRSTVAAITGTSGGLGLLIPPSLSFIILGDVLGTSVGDLFIAGILPGILLTTFLSVACYFSCRKREEIKLERRYSWRERWLALLKALPAFLIPVSILTTINTGMATPTEAAGTAVVIALLLGLFYYRKLKFKTMEAILLDTARSTSSIWFVVMGAMIFGRVLGFEGVPQAGAVFVGNLGLSYLGFIGGVFLLYFVLGMFFDAFILMLAALPPLLGALSLYNVPTVWFGVVFTLIVIIGQVTPPVGITLYAAAAGAQADVGETLKETVPYFLALLAAAAIIILVPSLIIC